MPVHLRWEIYPVAHEKGRPYGGSYLEDIEWWHRPRSISLFGEFKTFVSEILFFKEYFKNKRGFWYFVYPFHIGLFLLIAWAVLILVGAILSLLSVNIVSANGNIAAEVIYYLTLVTGLAGFVTGLFGTIGLLIKRATDKDLKIYTDPIDYFNLACILAIFIVGLAAWLVEDRTFGLTRSYVQGLLVFKPVTIGPVLVAFLLISSLFLLYMPFTRMLHYVAKYFTYHKVRWDDEPSRKGGKMEQDVEGLLRQQGDWSASHIQQGKTWSEQAAGTGIPDKTEVK
jgi:nitrate reductase gamma subunit